MRQNNTHKKNITHSAVAHSPACERKLGEYFFLDTFNPGFQRVFEPFLRVFKVFPHSKGFQSASKFQKLRSKSALIMGICATFTCFRENVAFCMKQEIASISITWNRGKSGDIHTYIHTYIHTNLHTSESLK